MADTPTKTPKKLTELRVIDLRSQLEQRGLEKTGVKAALIERLKKALEDEGKNSDELVFDVSEKKTTPAKKINGSSDADQDKEKTADEEDVEDEVDETEDAEMVVPDIKVDNVKEEEKTEKMEVDKADTEVDVTPNEEPKAEEEMETEDAVMADAKVLDEVTDEDAINLTIEDEDKLLADDEDEEAVKTEEPKDAEKEKETDKPSEVNGDQGEDKSAKGDESNKENTEAAVNVNSEAGAENPPSPTSAPVPEPSLTTEDLLKLHTTADRKDDDISLVVHVDDTQNDLDNDLLGTPMKKTPTNASEDTDTPKGNEAADDATKASEETAKPAGDKKPVTPSAKKPAADQKKTPSAADAKKADGKKEDSTKKTPEKKADGKKDADKKDDKAKSDSKSASKTSSKDDRSKDSSSSSSSRNLWVSGLSSATRATDLKTLFSKHGKVVGAKVVTNPRSPGSRCYGFVTMSTTEEASRCIQHLHRTELHGRMISVERGNVTLQAKNEPSVHPPSSRSSRPTSSRDDRRVPKKDDKAAEKKDTKPSEKKDTKPTEKKDEKKDEGKKDEAKKDEKKDPEKKPDAKKAEGDKKEEKKDGEKKEEEKKDGEKSAEKKDEKKDGEKKDDRSSHRHSSSRHSASSDRRSDGRRPADSRDKRDQQKKEDVLSFQKIKAERERERLKQQERRLREEERRRARDLERERQRQREIARQQKEEADRLQRERDKIRMERERLERERIAMERADREGRMERERRERERIERERDEARRLTQLRMEQDRRPAKRTYDRGVGAARDSRDDQYWQTEPKRPALAADRPFNSGSNFSDNRGFGDFGGPARGGYEDTMDRRVERYDRKDARPIDSGARHTDTGRFDSHREDPAVRRGRDPIPSRDTGPSRDRDDRRTFDDRRPERTATADRSFERYDDRGLTTRDTDRRGAVPERRDTDRRDTDRRVSPDRRQDVRNDWKTDSRGMSTTGRDSHRPAYDAGMKGSTASSREPWVDSRKDSWPSSSLDSQNLSRGQTDRWANTASTDRTMSTMRGSQHSSSSLPLSTPLLATPSNNQSFLTSAANIMMGVGMAGNRSTQDDRYNAYKNISGGSVRRY